MARIFISYGREDRATVKRLVKALARDGLDAWWDAARSRSWDEEIASRILDADVAIVIWSKASIGSNAVRAEAGLAREHGKLMPIRIHDVVPPVGFGKVQTTDLIGWRGEPRHPEWRAVVELIRRRLTLPEPERRGKAGAFILAASMLAAAGLVAFVVWTQVGLR